MPKPNGEHRPAGDLDIRDSREVPVQDLLELFRHTDWANTRQAESVKAALQNTFLVLTGWHAGRCVALIRVLGDGVFRAMIDDVIVHPDYQSRGWGRVMMDAALKHPKIRDVEEVALFTIIPKFYEKFGFAADPMAMKLKRPRRS